MRYLCITYESQAQIAFDKVPEFKDLYKPKHHFVSHACMHVVRLGPMRGYWCYSFEGFHQRVKRILRNCNYRNASNRCLKFWCMQFSRIMAERDPVRRREMSNLC